MENNLVDKDIATEFGRPLQVVAENFRVSGNQPALRVAHPGIKGTRKLPVTRIALGKCVARLENWKLQR